MTRRSPVTSRCELHSFLDADLYGGTGLTVGLAVAFICFSPGWSLIATFVPGLIFAYVTFVLVAKRGLGTTAWQEIAPIFFMALSLQLLHFAEEYATGFATRFPPAFGGQPFSRTTFVSFNMAAYAVFVLSALASLRYGARTPLLPLLFFVVYGTWGNAVSHLTWCVITGGYFPGAGTASLYLILGPLLLHAFVRDWRAVGLILGLTTVTLILCSTTLWQA